uniref:Uncharacterized protein n=1 Tax=Erpetoichthys calabaricus TaxID=27687 RepID=A0A8C4SNE2_ERPCA
MLFHMTVIGKSFLSSARAASGVSKSMLSGPNPKTLKERTATAKKYNMNMEGH